jgi:Ras-related protein Rab-18
MNATESIDNTFKVRYCRASRRPSRDEPNSHALFRSNSITQILLVGDSGVGKSSLLLRFATGEFEDDLQATIGVDFKSKVISVNGKNVKLTIWDTAGQERFRTLTSSYYRGAQGIVYVFDVTRRETFESLGEIWMQEVAMYSTIEDSIKMIVANKTDLESFREVDRHECIEFAKKHGCLYVETSAKGNIAVGQAFEELVIKVLETPSLLGELKISGVGLNGRSASAATSSCC